MFDPRTFSSGDVDVNENSINFSSRYFETGDRVIYIETSPIGGLVDQEIIMFSSMRETRLDL